MRIGVFEVEDWEREAFEPLGGEHELVFCSEPLDEPSARDFADAGVVSTFIRSSLDRPVLERLEALELVATRSTGVDHIDLDYCREADITVCNVPTYGANTVAEHVFGLLLTISHRLWTAIDRTRKGDFSLDGLRGFDLMGRTMGIVGTGSIGRHVARIARGFGMEVLAFDVEVDEAFARDAGVTYVSLDDLLAQADVVSLHVPLNDDTRGMIGAAEFERMKDEVVLINTARGAIVDHRALVHALSDGTIAAAGLDVLPEEPLIREEAELLRAAFRKEHDTEALLADHILLRLRNVYITPHSAFDTREAVERILDTTVENIRSFLGGDAENVVAAPDRSHEGASP